ncbi:hypothetical protein [Xanthomonas campestris]|uniref:hypothetical protein n=1 Tax=Xanthomonas campestris TaxID=339 RepID=UPI001E4E2758|nr:hypothetical protein [Xanthomonas campestris]MCC5086435.1 hypothetical protein [Xanthomonas campestris]MCF8795254.1 hypothetical protein [Xanthomonas campestris pv. campestris]MCF8815935.1 hypothetical protein [Xanthomonas campestris pv. campestris]WHO89009.1 hypothetical protein QMY63_01615 [Xanthomonas campestris]
MPLIAQDVKLGLDGRWDLEDLSEMTREYVQLYGFAYSLMSELPSARREEIDYIYGKFPWQGGYSTVNFFNQIFHKIPQRLRPQLKRIQYASPGFIELTLLLAAAVTVSRIVKSVCSAVNVAHDAYRNIQKGAVEHRLSKVNVNNQDSTSGKARLISASPFRKGGKGFRIIRRRSGSSESNAHRVIPL